MTAASTPPTDNTTQAAFPRTPETHQRAGNENPHVVEAVAPAEGRDVTIALNRLKLSSNNVRKTRHADDLGELAALIESQGLLQRLSITDAGDGTYAVEAGGRRLGACQLLVQRGVFADDQPIDCRLYASSRAVEISLAENSGRTDMHPADQFEAMARLIDEGLSLAQVAGRFGVSVLTVERRMALAKLAPRFIAMYRVDQIAVDQLQALSLTTDHALQVAAWESLPEYNRSAYMLRSALVDEEIEGDSRLARFVGMEAYLAAGGTVRRDLFESECWLQDGALVHELAMARLEEAAEKERAAGWSWVEAQLSVDTATSRGFGHERPMERSVTQDEVQVMEEWQALMSDAMALVAESERQWNTAPEGSPEEAALLQDVEQAEEDAANLQEIESLLRASLTEWSDPQRARCGAVISINARGELEVTRGLLRQQDRKAVVAALRKAGKPVPAHLQGPTQGAGAGERGAYSERLMLDMTAHRTAALQAALTHNAHVALALVVHRLAEPIFSTAYRALTSPLKLSASLTRHTQLGTRATAYGESQAAGVLDQVESLWGDRLPGGDREASTLAWFVKQDDHTLMELLALCAASSLDAMHGRERPAYDDADALAEALDVDMCDWWAPTPANYLGSVSKAQLIEAVSEACGPEVAKPIAGMKKADAVAYCAAKLEGTRWLPVPLKRKPAPSAQ
ncbi:ParB/RepB/Spo0J family partition protein [Variovorax saccharolyticus]|uniref:ParB/RepB/Spo0J family partition protein n=1 Tax=Variovorax saccharolyticus TaxID=3053516 RepID=UPI0025760640|nr:ParB/Srx family N-terminal domain-containing protein [Variovorax sp. J31P216]MDM0029148.1 ParB/Srx family N-terminal domain-containing protein [Variovorax sp. J31P216]